jgi:hypothetical protein
LQYRNDIRNIAIIALFLLLLPLAGCGRGAVEQATDPTQPTQTSAETTSQITTSSEEASTQRHYGMYYDPDDPPGPSDIWYGLQLQSKEDKTSFLSLFGITEKTVPFYRYYNNDSVLKLELYYDTEKEEGVGVYYAINGYEEEWVEVFRISAPEPAVWKDHKFLLTSEYHDEIHYSVTHPKYKEHMSYNKQDKPSAFLATAEFDGEGNPYTIDLIKITWHYRKDGTLWKKVSFNESRGGTHRGLETFYYDYNERLKYVNAYITSGSMEDYYIYDGNNTKPTYRLTLIHSLSPAWACEFVKY